jgi:hypothetical protein
MNDYPKVVLLGYSGSQGIVPASKYLTSMYMPMFNFIYLNNDKGPNMWSDYVAGFLEYLTDEYVIFSLDDYLLADYIHIDKFEEAEAEIGGDVVCVKLCQSTEQEHEEYPVTTQYTIWNREFLIWLLRRPEIRNPWQFEIEGSKIFRTTGKKVLHRPCLDYFTNSSISSRWEGVRLDGLKEEDVKTVSQWLK